MLHVPDPRRELEILDFVDYNQDEDHVRIGV